MAEDPTPPPTDYTIQELGQLMFDMQIRAAKSDKTMMNHKYEHENFARQQTLMNKTINDSLARLTDAVMKSPSAVVNHDRPPDKTRKRGWRIPPSLTVPPTSYDPETWPKLTSDPPRFNGDDATDWIRKIQKFYNHSFMPLEDRLYLMSFLFDQPASDWMSYWEDNNEGRTWTDFLVDVKQRFAPDLYEDYVGRLANLQQTTTVEAYQTALESDLLKVSNVNDATLTSLFIAGLKPDLKRDLLTKQP